MKKLMVAIAAVASAFGLYATDPIFQSSFETDGEIPPQNGWATEDAEAAFTQKDGDVGAGVYDTGNVRYSFFQGANEKYLGIKTKLDTPVLKTLDAAIGDEAVYFDQLVKFTATDEAQSFVGDADTKIALYVQDLTEAETPSAATNLYVIAGQYVDGVFSSDHVYDLGPIDVDVWHRVTVKTLKALSTSVGFEVFVDGEARQYLGESKKAYDGVAGSLEKLAQAMNASSKIFPARVSGLTVAKVGFAGQGEIDDFIATTTSPGTWADDKNFTLAWNADSHLTALKYTVYGEEVTADLTAGSAVIPWSSGMMVTVAPTFVSTTDETWSLGEYAGEGFTAVGNVLTVSSDSTTATIVAKETTPRLVVVGDDGEPTGVTYPSFKAALADEALESGAALKLAMDVEIGVGDEGVTDGVITKDLTIDLNGKTISGVEGASDTYVFTVAGCTLTVKDSSGSNAGAIQPGADYLGAVLVASTDADNIGQIVVEGGTFEGAVTLNPEDLEFNVPAGTASIAGGLFVKEGNSTEDEKFALADSLADGYKVGASAGDYWEVVAKDKFTVSVTGAANATVKINDQEVTSLELNEGDDYEVVVTPNAYYEYAEEGSYGAFIWTEGTLVATGTANAAVALTAADATAKEYKAKYYEADGETEVAGIGAEYKTFTIVNAESKTLPQPEKAGYTFVGWYASVDDLTDPDAEPLGNGCFADYAFEELDLEAYAKWEQAAPTEYTVTLTKGTGIATISEASVKGAPGEKKTVTLTADGSIAIPVFKANGVQCSATYEVEIPAADYEITFTATDASSGDVTDDQAKKALEDKGVASTATAKFPGNTKALATWMAAKGALPEAINASNYLKASVDLDVALITEQTAVATAADTFAATGSGLTFNIKVGDAEVAAEKAINYVKATDDLSTWSADNVTKAVEAGAVKVTSTTGKAFAKVVIPTDDTIND